MSIEDMTGKTLIRVSTLWEWAFKAMLVTVPFGFSLLIAFGCWLTLKVLEHDTELAHIKGRMENSATAAIQAPAAKVAAHLMQSNNPPARP